MNTEYKKQLNRFAICVFSFISIILALLSMITYSAFSVHYAIQQENSELQPRSKELNKKFSYPLTYNTDNFYSTKLKSFYDTDLYLSNNTNNFDSYISAQTRDQDWTSDVYYTFTYWGDFTAKVDVAEQTFDVMFIRYKYHGSLSEVDEYLELRWIYLQKSNTSTIYHIYNRADDFYRFSVLKIDNIRNFSRANDLNEVYEGSILDFLFDKVIGDNDDLYEHTFQSGPKNLPQYLKSYNRLQYGQIMYSSTDTNTDSLSIPMTFICNGRLYDRITILLRPCWYYYNSAGEIISNSDVFPSGQGVPYVCTYVLFGYYGRTLSWTYDTNIAGLLTSVTNGSMAMFLGYNGYSQHTGTSPSDNFYAPNYLLVQGLQVNSDYQTIQIKDVDSVPFLNTTGTNLKPYNNITIRNILESYFNFYGDVNGYNGSYYDVGLGSVFTLLSSAFQSLIPLMAIQIIPGITIGLLIMLPLIVTIILVILKLVKK